MKFFTVNMVILILIVSIEAAESARIRRNEGSKKKSNLAVMLAYKPNSEIRTKDEHDNTWTTYRVKSEDDRNVSEEELNKKLLDILVKQKFGNYEAKPINKKRHTISSCESNETIDDAKVVEVKKDCYKNTYKNVLNAFEEALKSQIQSYKKCVCQKKQQSTTTTTTTPEPSTIAPRAASSDSEEEQENNVNLNNDQELASAIDNSDDVICFHKQYAFMLEKLLNQIPKCKAEQQQQLLDLDVFGGNAQKRQERHNVKEINASESNEVENNAELKDQIMDILKDYLSSKKRENVKPTTTTTTTTTTQSPPSIIESEENLNEEKFFERLRNLFKQLESDDETFHVPKNTNRSTHIESAASVSSSKSSKKSSDDSKARKSRRTEVRSVTEHSDESTENTIKLKKGKFGKKYFTSEELSRGDKAKNSKLSKIVKSYRTTSRSPPTSTTPNPTHDTNNSKYYSDEEEEETSKEMPAEARNRNVDDLAKAISDLAKKYIK